MNTRKFVICTLIVLLMLTPLIAGESISTFQDTKNTQIPIEKSLPAMYDLDRVEYRINNLENPGFEEWTDFYRPDLVSTGRSQEKYAGIVNDPFPVANGSSSLLMQVRSLTGDYTEKEVNEGSWSTINMQNPVNLTMSFYYYIENIPNPINSDHFYLEFRLENAGTRYLRYYFGSTPQYSTNSTYYRYFLIDAPFGEWHLFDRNITADYIDGFSLTPITYDSFDFYLRTYSQEYSRVYLDTIYIYNTTLYKSDTYDTAGDIRGRVGGSYNTDPGIISQSDTRVADDYSLNMSCYSLGNRSYAQTSYNLYKRFTQSNQDKFEFMWRITDWTKYSEETSAYVYVECRNATHDFNVYYLLAYGDTFKHNYSGYTYIIPESFNSTGSWNHFNRSIWEDVTSHNSTSEVIVTNIEIEIESNEYQGNITILFDEINLYAATLNDMSYEDEGSVMDNIYAWNIGSSERSFMNVTSTAYTGSKAANITIDNSDSLYAEQDMPYIDLTSETERYLTFAYYIDDFTNLTDDFIQIEVYFEGEGDSLTYVLANGSSRGGEGEYYILLNSTPDVWHFAERDLVLDYTTAFETVPNDRITEIYLEARGEGRIEILLDDLYLFEDPAPTISNLVLDPVAPEYIHDTLVSVDVVDPHLDTVLLHYRINGGTFAVLEMLEDTQGSYEAVIPQQDYNDVVEYFVSANDTYGKSTELLDNGDYFSFVVQDTILPIISITDPANESTVSDVIDITVSASDAGSDIERVLIYIDSTLVANLTSGPFTYSWNTTAETDGYHEILVEVIDNAGNENTSLHVVTVDNPDSTSTTSTETTDTTTDTTTPPPPPDITLILVIVGVIGAVVVIIVVIMLRNKRG